MALAIEPVRINLKVILLNIPSYFYYPIVDVNIYLRDNN